MKESQDPLHEGDQQACVRVTMDPYSCAHFRAACDSLALGGVYEVYRPMGVEASFLSSSLDVETLDAHVLRCMSMVRQSEKEERTYADIRQEWLQEGQVAVGDFFFQRILNGEDERPHL